MTNESTADAPAAPRSSPLSSRAVGVSVLSATLALAFALVAIWIIQVTYERYRGRNDLDMPEWFVINFDLTVKVILIDGAGAICLLVSAVSFAGWIKSADWLLRAAFIVQWWIAAALIGLPVWSRIP